MSFTLTLPTGMVTSNCLHCKKSLEKEFSNICGICEKGICWNCAEEFREEVNRLSSIENQTCQYCTEKYEKYCNGCKESTRQLLDTIKQRNIPNEVKSYGVEHVDQITEEIIKRGIRCTCNPNCKCYVNSQEFTKTKWNLSDLILYEIYDEEIDYCVIRCQKCLIEGGSNLVGKEPFF